MEAGYLKKIAYTENPKEFKTLIVNGLQETSEKILSSINPVTQDSLPFIIASMEKILENIKQLHPDADEVAKAVYQSFKVEHLEICVDENKLRRKL